MELVTIKVVLRTFLTLFSAFSYRARSVKHQGDLCKLWGMGELAQCWAEGAPGFDIGNVLYEQCLCRTCCNAWLYFAQQAAIENMGVELKPGMSEFSVG